ncbi:MAG: hypothetical protein Q9214_000142 [Letrouitia sp. 1 TL-2023]
MRLIHTTELQLYEFFEKEVPPYAILSHTWGKNEITFSEFQRMAAVSAIPEDSKIARCCRLAASEGWCFVWIDTCCIDKSSSAELTESINSMYKWYEGSKMCYAHLADISLAVSNREENTKKFGESRWFTRGWTLQELLAPCFVEFYDRDWLPIGSKTSLTEAVSKASNIPVIRLNSNPRAASIAARMSWASRRETTRPEDEAYCLLGLFDINMPLVYGEGVKAFRRLQYEIIRSSPDESIFVWSNNSSFVQKRYGILAKSPSYFKDSGDIIYLRYGGTRSIFSITNRGIEMTLPVRNSESNSFEGRLACARNDNNDVLQQPLIRFQPFYNTFNDKPGFYPVSATEEDYDYCARTNGDRIELFERGAKSEWKVKTFLFRTEDSIQEPAKRTYKEMRLTKFFFTPSLRDELGRIYMHSEDFRGEIDLVPKKIVVLRSRSFYLRLSIPLARNIFLFRDTTTQGKSGILITRADHASLPKDAERKSTRITPERPYIHQIKPGAFLFIKLRQRFHEDYSWDLEVDVDVTNLDRSKIF